MTTEIGRIAERLEDLIIMHMILKSSIPLTM